MSTKQTGPNIDKRKLSREFIWIPIHPKIEQLFISLFHETKKLKLIINSSPLSQTLFASLKKMSEEKECIICYESLQSVNLCVTPCGHEFCFKCMMLHVQRSSGCPCCRATIVEDIEMSDDEDDEDYEESDTSSIHNEEEEGEQDDSYPIEKLVEVFESKGYGLKDALSLLMFKFSKTDQKYTKNYIHQLETDIEDAHEELQNQHEEQINMMSEDVRA